MASKTKNTKSKTSGRRKGGTAKRSSRNQKLENNFLLMEEVILIGVFAVCLLLLLSNFGMCGPAGEFLKKVQLGIFGSIGFVMPVLLFIGVCFCLSNVGNRAAAIKFLAMVVLLVAISGFLQLVFGQDKTYQESIWYFYQYSSISGLGGGLLGGSVAAGLKGIFGTAGTYLILFVIAVVGIVCITEKSLVGAVKTGGGKAYRYAREDLRRRKREQEEKRKMRDLQPVSGVDLSATQILKELAEEDWAEKPVFTSPKMLSEEDKVSTANIFNGEIQLPYFEDQEDETEYVQLPEFKAEELHTVGDVKELDQMPWPEESGAIGEIPPSKAFVIPQDEKRVETVSGKVIETDTELLHKKIEQKKEERQMEQEEIPVSKPAVPPPKYKFPPLSLLVKSARGSGGYSEQEYKQTAIKLQQTLQSFGVGVTVTNISCGPSVTRYELYPEQGVKVSRIVGLADDIKLSLAAADIRIEAPIPGKSAVGIEVPNKQNTMVLLRDLLESAEFQKGESKLSFAVGKDIGGQVVVTDIAKMPHLLIAGATGSGKSVCINTLIMSVIYKADPADVKLIMIDPKVVELSVYNGLPHLLIPVVTDPKKAAGALNWAVAEMTDRYQKFAQYNVRDLKGYNAKIKTIEGLENENDLKQLPQIIIIVDELADLMMVAPGEVEDAICRLAQLARAAGIHLVIATQRPSVNVITGLIKANVPSRIAFSVSSGVDSRTIIDMNGAEKLLGKGDMLFYPAGYQKPQRVQGAFVSDQEVSKVVDFLLEQQVVTEYQPDIESQIQNPVTAADSRQSGRDEYFYQAAQVVIEKEKASIGFLQRVFKIGFNRAARIMDQLYEAGVVGEEEGTKPRKVLLSAEEFEQLMNK